MKISFSEVFADETKNGTKLKTSDYQTSGTHPIIDQGQDFIAGYTDSDNGLYTDVPAIIFGDHTRVLKYVDFPFFLGADGAKILKARSAHANYKYLYYALKSVRIPDTGYNRHFKWLKEAAVSIPGSQKQESIVFTLDSISRIISRRKSQLAKLDELVKCRFVEMFGDMIYNPNKWEEKALQSVADIVSGITKGRKISDTKLIEVPYMSVCNVKDGYIDWTNLKTILATNKEIEQYRILANDVLMTEGGDPDKVGRGAIISSPPSNCIHQNHIFRVRLSEEVEAIYFEQYLQQPKARQYFYRSAKQTTGIASINMSQLKAMPVLLPPLALQEQFADFVRRIDKSRFAEMDMNLD